MEQKISKCEVMAIANQKGGVGKTTTAINLGASLAIAEKRVLLMDVDPQGNTTTGLGLDKKNLEYELYSVMIGEEEVSSVICDTELDFLKLLPSSRKLAMIEVEAESDDENYMVLKKIVDSLRDDFDYILLDLPPSLGLLTINALTASDSVLVPIQAEYYALEGLADLVDTIERTKESFNPELEIKGILMTMYDERTNLSKQVMDEVRKYFDDKVYSVVIPRNVRLSEAPSFGKPIQLYDIKSKGSLAYFALAKELLLK